MRDKKVWVLWKLEKVPKDSTILGTKWVFKKKASGEFRSHLVALGYNQIPGVDYSDSYAPVINDATFRMVVVLWLLNDWNEVLIDVETAFLYGNLDEPIYLKCPDGMELPKDEVLKLEKSIYGLVQAARQW